MASSSSRRSSLIERASAVSNVLYISDVRQDLCKEEVLPFDDNVTFEQFKESISKLFNLGEEDKYVVTTTYREEVTADTFGCLEPGDTLYLLNDKEQELKTQTKEKVNYLPHYDTIVKGGMYEYYASEGQNPLSYAFAELIDNALAATNENAGPRNVEIRLHLDEDKIFVIDNGKGMTSRQLNNWAIYRLSKFIRRDTPGKFGNGNAADGSPFMYNTPRSLNSDISYFGVGGKQAIFFIGTATTMITKQRGIPDVHELSISREQFEKKEQNREEIYSGFIRNRKIADASHVPAEEETLHSIIEEEKDKESFTVVMIQGINPDHLPYLKLRFKDWTRQLSHIYHYYIHGPNGNVDKEKLEQDRSAFNAVDIMPDDWFTKINIKVKMFTKANKDPITVNLRDITDDAQTNFIRSAASTFEFKAIVEGTGVAEGVLRYHPFLYDRETFPLDHSDVRVEVDPEDDHDYTVSDTRPARGRRPIFECYWNGRLIPYTTVNEFNWCSLPKKPKGIPLDCYNRISGVIWTNDKFQVSTNKLTFIDLEGKLRDKQTVFCRVTGKSEKRTDISKEFTNWLKECHENLDKQIKFTGFKGKHTRPELPKSRQTPWALYSKIEWDGKLYGEGTIVRIHRTLPVLYGCITKIWLYGDYDGDVYATGGEIEIIQEPRSLYGELKTVPLSKLDRSANDRTIKKYLEDEEGKLPDKLAISWPSGDEVKPGEKRAAGKAIGDIKVEIVNCKGEYINRLPGSQQRKLLVELKIVWHSPHGDKVLNNHISQHGKNWGYWFRRMENINSLGTYTLHLQTILSENEKTSISNKQLPGHKIKFTVTESEPVSFSVGMLDAPFRIGVPFTVPLEFQDEFGNAAKPDPKFNPLLEASDLTLTYKEAVIKGNCLLINEIIAEGDLGRNAFQGKSFNLKVRVKELDALQTLKIRMLPGPPHSIHVTPDSFNIENGDCVTLAVEIHDVAGNVTAYQRSNATVKFAGALGTPTYNVDCQRTGQGTLSNKQVLLKKIKGEETIHATVELNSFRSVPAVEIPITVRPSSRAANITITYDNDGEDTAIEQGVDIVQTAGDFIRGLKFTLEDEAGRPKNLENSFASKIKVNWSPKVPPEMVLGGRLPDIKVPFNVNESKYCHVTLLDGSGLDFSFVVRALAGPPAQIKCVCQGSNKVRLGEVLQSDINVLVIDEHGNHIKKLEKSALGELTVTGEGLADDEIIRGFAQNSGFNIERVRIVSGELGSREIKVRWRDFEDSIRLEVMPGPPDKLIIDDWDLDQPLVIYNNGRTPHPLITQLCDAAGNPTAEPGIKVQLTRDIGIRLTPTPQPMKTDKKGQANFGYFVVYGKSGTYEIQPKAFIGRNIILGPKLQIFIQLDPNKPVALEVIEKQSDASPEKLSVKAGDRLPDMMVKVIAEDESVMSSAKQSCLRMKIGYPDNRPSYSIQPPDNKTKNDEPGVYHFSQRSAPDVAGIYAVVFSYVDGVKYNLQTQQYPLKVIPGSPERLEAVEDPGTPTVSNTKSPTNRMLIKHLRLQLKDKYGNDTGSNLSGVLSVEVRPTSQHSDQDVPCLAGNTHNITVPLVKGSATIEDLMIEENTSGKDGQEYVLYFTVNGSDSLSDIPPYKLSFLFYNDVKKQSQMAALSKERDNLLGVIRTYRSLFDTTQQLIDELKLSVKEAESEVEKIKTELRKTGITQNQISTLASIDKTIAESSQLRDELKEKPRRCCGLSQPAKDPNILGKIAHLAEIEDEDCARVLSWHMSADMDCIVTMTTAKAREIHSQSGGKQQLLPLDSIYKKNLPDWKKPLPHVRLRPNWQPKGNPVYARDLLGFPYDPENCRIVFGMLLGDTVILDTLEDANQYRQEIVKFTHCPTLLTRDGERIRSNGKFGGLMNKALPIEKLRGAVFSAPLPKQYYDTVLQIDLLQNYRNAFTKHSSAKDELLEQTKIQNSPEMKAKYKECQEAEDQLDIIESRLGFSRPVKTNSTKEVVNDSDTHVNKRLHSDSSTASSPSSPPANTPKVKRSRVINSSNQQPSPTAAKVSTSNSKHKSPTVTTSTATPLRTSTRRAAAESSLAWESLRKRPRRSLSEKTTH